MHIDAESIVIDSINRRINPFYLFIGTEAGHELIIDGKRIPLESLAAPQAAVQFTVKRFSLFGMFLTNFLTGVNL